MRKVWKSWINGGQFSAKQGKSSFAGIWLDSCRNIIISHPWIRKSGDGMGTPTHDVYLSDGSEQIYFISAFYYGLPITINTDVTVDKSKIVNLDTFVSSRKKHFISAKDFSLAQGTPQLQKVGNLEAWVLGRQNPHQAVLTSHIAPSRVKAIHLLWFNNSAESAGSVSWQLMHSNIAFGSSVEGPRNYTNVSSQVQSNGILIKTTLIPSLSMNGGDLFYLWVVRNSSDSNGDTLAGDVGLVGIELEYE